MDRLLGLSHPQIYSVVHSTFPVCGEQRNCFKISRAYVTLQRAYVTLQILWYKNNKTTEQKYTTCLWNEISEWQRMYHFRFEWSSNSAHGETHRHQVSTCSSTHALLVLHKNKNKNNIIIIIIIKIVGHTINKTKTDKTLHCSSNYVKRVQCSKWSERNSQSRTARLQQRLLLSRQQAYLEVTILFWLFSFAMKSPVVSV